MSFRSGLGSLEPAGAERLLVAAAAELDPARLAEVLSYVNLQGQTFAYPLRRMLQHVVNHGTYHRGQITTLLRQLGAAPLATDLLLYDDGKTKAS